MVKFKKLLEQKTIENNGKYTYINYKKLKRIINETYIKLRITQGTIKNNNPKKAFYQKLLSFFLFKRLNDDEYSSRISDIQKFSKNSLIKDFFIELNKEINSLYKFYSREEISISNELNQIVLNKIHDMDALTTIDDDCQKIYLIALKIKLLYECLIFNFEAIRKICKKFDKKLRTFLNNNSFCVYYLKALIDYLNSDLAYLLKMQIIEQGLVIIKYKIGNIVYRKNILLSDKNKKNKLTNLDYNIELTEEDLIKEINDYLEKTNDIIEEMVTNEKFIITNINLGLKLKYDGDIKNINDYNYRDIENEESLSFKDEYAIDYDNEHITALLKKEESLSILRMFINKDVYKNIINIFFYYLNELNYNNIVLIFLHLSFNYLLLGVSYIQIFFILLDKEEKEIKYYGLFIGIIFLSQLLSNKILSHQKLANIKSKIWISISLIIPIFLQLSYLYLTKSIEEKKISFYSFWIWPTFFSFFEGFSTSSKLSAKYLLSCVPKNTLLMLSKNLVFYRNLFLYMGIILFYLFNKYFSIILIFIYLIITIFFLLLFTEKNSENFYTYKTNFNELLKKIKIFNNSGEIIEVKPINYNKDDIFSDEFNRIESVAYEDLKEEQKIHLEKVNKEFNEINEKSHFNISNYVPQNTKLFIKNISQFSKRRRAIFLFFFYFLSVFYKQSIFLISLINYIKKANIIDINNHHIHGIYIYNITIYDILIVISLPFGYLLYKAFNRYNDIHSIFKFYFVINSILLFILAFQYDSNYLLLFFIIFISFNYIMDEKINIFFAANYRNEVILFAIKVNNLINYAYYLGKIVGSFIFYFFFEREFYFLLCGSFIYFAASFYNRFIKLSKIIILGRGYSKEIY